MSNNSVSPALLRLLRIEGEICALRKQWLKVRKPPPEIHAEGRAEFMVFINQTHDLWREWETPPPDISLEENTAAIVQRVAAEIKEFAVSLAGEPAETARSGMAAGIHLTMLERFSVDEHDRWDIKPAKFKSGKLSLKMRRGRKGPKIEIVVGPVCHAE